MSGERSVEGAVEVDALDRVQIVGERHHRPAGFHDGEGHAGVANHVGVGGALGVVERGPGVIGLPVASATRSETT